MPVFSNQTGGSSGSSGEPLFNSSPAKNITSTNISNWNSANTLKHSHDNLTVISAFSVSGGIPYFNGIPLQPESAPVFVVNGGDVSTPSSFTQVLDGGSIDG